MRIQRSEARGQRSAKVMAFALIAALLLMTTGCPTPKNGSGQNKYTPYIKTGVRVLGKTKTIFAANGLSIDKLDLAIKGGNAAVAALESSASNSLELIANFIDAFDAIAAYAAASIKNQTTRMIVMVGLAVGSEALHDLADQMKKDGAQQTGVRAMAMRRSSGAQRISAFATKPRWQCRNSINGQYAEMKYCEEHPDTSTVERH